MINKGEKILGLTLFIIYLIILIYYTYEGIIPADYFTLAVTLDFVSILIGLEMVLHYVELAREKAVKKLGYGPAIIGRNGITWPSNYYSNFWLGKIKPQYKNKVDSWMKEFKKNRNNFYFLLGLLLFFIGIILPILFELCLFYFR